MLPGIATAILLVLFIAVCVWAFSPKRKRDFDAAARLPLSDEPPASGEGAPRQDTPTNGHGQPEDKR